MNECYTRDNSLVCTKIDIIKHMEVSDLYFMVEWFCLILNYVDKLSDGASGHLL